MLALFVPPAVVTKTLTGPFATELGVLAVIVVELTTVTFVARIPLMVTVVGPTTKSVPVIVMGVPPFLDPELGVIFVTVGGA